MSRTVENGIESIKDLVDWNSDISQNGASYLYRGLPDSDYKLIPKISRKWSYDPSSQSVDPKTVKRRLEKLQGYLSIRLPAYGFDFHNLDSRHRSWKELFIAQHYGVPTSLLDFTRNPMAGLFFACLGSTEHDGLLFATGIKEQHFSQREDFDAEQNDYNIATYDLTR